MPDFILKTGLPLILKLISNMKHFDHSPKLRRFLWALLWVAALYALRLPDLITALRWW